MARTVVIFAILSLLVIAVGCESTDTGLAHRLPRRTTDYANPAVQLDSTGTSDVVNSTDEVDLIEQVVKFRRGYRQSLALLVQKYSTTGDNRRLNWAREELKALDRIPQYRYIIDPDVLPSDLTATARVPAADQLYEETVNIQRQAEPLGAVLKDEELLRVAMAKYTQLIRQYPTSDKIDDAAFRAAGIYEYFKDYETALLYYKRAYAWDPATPNPARFYAAELLDKKLRRRDEALSLYQEAIAKESGHSDLKAYAERRIKELTRSEN